MIVSDKEGSTFSRDAGVVSAEASDSANSGAEPIASDALSASASRPLEAAPD